MVIGGRCTLSTCERAIQSPVFGLRTRVWADESITPVLGPAAQCEATKV